MKKVVYQFQECQQCNRKFSWGEIYLLGMFYKPIECNKCGTKHKIAFSGRCIVTLLTIFPMLTFVLFLSIFNLFATWSIGLIIFVIGSLLVPNFIRIKVE